MYIFPIEHICVQLEKKIISLATTGTSIFLQLSDHHQPPPSIILLTVSSESQNNSRVVELSTSPLSFIGEWI